MNQYILMCTQCNWAKCLVYYSLLMSSGWVTPKYVDQRVLVEAERVKPSMLFIGLSDVM